MIRIIEAQITRRGTVLYNVIFFSPKMLYPGKIFILLEVIIDRRVARSSQSM